jgi:hypothetical protein
MSEDSDKEFEAWVCRQGGLEYETETIARDVWDYQQVKIDALREACELAKQYLEQSWAVHIDNGKGKREAERGVLHKIKQALAKLNKGD